MGEEEGREERTSTEKGGGKERERGQEVIEKRGTEVEIETALETKGREVESTGRRRKL